METQLVGRKAEQFSLLQDLERGCRLLNIVGLGGVGKTSLAKSVLQESKLPNRFFSCASMRSTDRFLEELTVFLQLQNPTIESIASKLAEAPQILCLDNVEDLATELSPVLLQLLEGAPNLVLLLTSRVPTHAPGEHILTLRPLRTESDQGQGPSDAMVLLTRKIQQKRPGWKPQANDQSCLHKLCELSSGIPLALELIASNASVLSLAQIVERLSSPAFDLKAAGHGWEEKHRSLFACLELSFRTLSLEESFLFSQLSIFPHQGFSPEVASAASGQSMEEVLARLEELSLLWSHEETLDGHTQKTFGMYEVVRRFATEKSDPYARKTWIDRLTVHLGARYWGPWTLVGFNARSLHMQVEAKRFAPLLDSLIRHYTQERPFPFVADPTNNTDLVCGVLSLIFFATAQGRTEGRYDLYSQQFLKVLEWGNHLPPGTLSSATYAISFALGTFAMEDSAWLSSASHPNHAAWASTASNGLPSEPQKAFVSFWKKRTWVRLVANGFLAFRNGDSGHAAPLLLQKAAVAAEAEGLWEEAASFYGNAMVFGLVRSNELQTEFSAESAESSLLRCLEEAGISPAQSAQYLYAKSYRELAEGRPTEAASMLEQCADFLSSWGWPVADTYRGEAALHRMRSADFADLFEHTEGWHDTIHRFFAQQRARVVRRGRLLYAIGWATHGRWALAEEAAKIALKDALSAGIHSGHIGALYAMLAWLRNAQGQSHQEVLRAAKENVEDLHDSYRWIVEAFERAIVDVEPSANQRAELGKYQTDEAMFCAQMLDAWLARRDRTRVANDGSWVEISKKRILVKGAVQRKTIQTLAAFKTPTSSGALCAALWPAEAAENDEKAMHRLRNRLRVLVHDLRGLGLSEVVGTDDDGNYQLINIEVVPT